jgi:hypothetical protein
MANGCNKTRKGDAGRDSGGFVALPWACTGLPRLRPPDHARKGLAVGGGPPVHPGQQWPAAAVTRLHGAARLEVDGHAHECKA